MKPKLISKLTSKYQATIPKDVRKALHIKCGDRILFEIVNGEIIIRKMEASDSEYLRGLDNTLKEWASPEDEEDYEHLQML